MSNVVLRQRRPLILAMVAIFLIASCSAGATNAPTSSPTPEATGTEAPTTAAPTTNPALAALIAKAKSEGTVSAQFITPSTGAVSDAEAAIAAGVKKAFGVDITFKIDTTINFGQAVSKVLSEQQAGGSPSYDLLIQSTQTGVPMIGHTQQIDYSLFPWISKDAIETKLGYNGAGVIIASQYLVPAYNTQLVQAADAPKSWADLLDPKWKGKIGTTSYYDFLQELAEPAAWGEAKTVDFAKGLAAQNPVLGTYPSLMQSLASGQVSVLAVEQVHRIQKQAAGGAPVAVVAADPVATDEDICMVPASAKNADAATLVCAWLASSDGQAWVLSATNSVSAASGVANPAAAVIAGKTIIVPTTFQITDGDRLYGEFNSIFVKK